MMWVAGGRKLDVPSFPTLRVPADVDTSVLVKWACMQGVTVVFGIDEGKQGQVELPSYVTGYVKCGASLFSGNTNYRR